MIGVNKIVSIIDVPYVSVEPVLTYILSVLGRFVGS